MVSTKEYRLPPNKNIISPLYLVLKGQEVLDYLNLNGANNSSVDLINIKERLTKLESEVNKQTISTYTANRLNEISNEIDSLKATLSTHEHLDHSELLTQLNNLKSQYEGLTASTLMTDKDRQAIISTFNGLKDNVFRQLSSAHEAIVKYVDTKILTSEKNLDWVEIYNHQTYNGDIRELIKTFTPTDKLIIRYLSNTTDAHNYTHTETNDVVITISSVMRDNAPELDITTMRIDGVVQDPDHIITIRKQVLK